MVNEIVSPLKKIFSPAPGKTAGSPPPAENPHIAGSPPVAPASAIANSVLDAKRAVRDAGKPGRHKSDCQCEKCKAGITNRTQARQPGLAVIKPAADFSDEDKELAREAIRAATNLMDSFALVCVGVALKKKNVDKQTSDDVFRKVPMSPEMRKGISDSGAVILQKHNALRFAPEIALGLFMASWLTGIFTLLFQINKIPEPEQNAETD